MYSGVYENIFNSPSCILAGGNRNASINVRDSPAVTMLTREGIDKVNVMSSPSIIYQGLSDESIQNAMKSPSLQTTSESKTRYDLPLPLIVGHPLIKTALLALAVNPTIGGIIIEGGRGTGKSVLARAIHRILPPIEVIKGSLYNTPPDWSDADIDPFLETLAMKNITNSVKLESAEVTCPFSEVILYMHLCRLHSSTVYPFKIVCTARFHLMLWRNDYLDR